MKGLLFWCFLIVTIVVGVSTVKVRAGFASKEEERWKFDCELRDKNKALANRYAKQMQEYEDQIDLIRRSGRDARSNIDNEVAGKIAIYEAEIKAKKEEQKFCVCRAQVQSDSCVPGLFRLAKGRPSSLVKKGGGAGNVCRHAAYLAEINISEDGRTCEFKYDNRTHNSIKPDVIIKFFDQDGRHIASAKNSWTFSSLKAGEKAIEKETIHGPMGNACYFRAE